jgi:predicted component of viral defense system (DUF524 family)
MPEVIEIQLDPELRQRASLFRHSEKLPLVVRDHAGEERVVADWPRTGTGRYLLRLELDDELLEEAVYEVEPLKISPASYHALIDDLQSDRLPASIAISLDRMAGSSALELRPIDETTPSAELLRLQRAIAGWGGRPGLAVALEAMARDPHRQLVKTEQWVVAERARRLEPVGLLRAIREPDNFDTKTQLPRRVPDVRVEHNLDVYENRLVRTFYEQVATRLRRLHAMFVTSNQLAGVAQAEALLMTMDGARRGATFLDEVSLLAHPPTRVTMVLLRRAPYRATLERYLEFRREAYVELDEPGLDLPLDNLPHLYELWGTLQVIDVLLEQARALGYDSIEHRLARQIGQGVHVKLLPDGVPAVTLGRSADGSRVRLIPQRTLGRTSSGIRSMSFAQRPDVVVEVTSPGRRPTLFVFDPKYKLQSEDQPGTTDAPEDAPVPVGQPKKIDIDTMHAYRDAIRDPDGERVVSYAAILYPGPEKRFPPGIEALTADPLQPELLRERVRDVLSAAIA